MSHVKRFLFSALQFDKVLFLYDIPPETTEEVLRAMFDCPICIIPLDEEGNNMG